MKFFITPESFSHSWQWFITMESLSIIFNLLLCGWSLIWLDKGLHWNKLSIFEIITHLVQRIKEYKMAEIQFPYRQMSAKHEEFAMDFITWPRVPKWVVWCTYVQFLEVRKNNQCPDVMEGSEQLKNISLG